MRHVTLIKYQTLGNAYLVFDPNRNASGGDGRSISPDWIRSVCDPNLGIGSNGLLVGPDRRGVDGYEFRIFNSDASQAQLSGNGSRIFARYLLDAGYVRPGERMFAIVPVSGDLDRIVVDVTARDGAASAIRTIIRIGPSFGPAAVAARGAFRPVGPTGVSVPALEKLAPGSGMAAAAWSDSTMVGIGNPHCVTFVSSLDALPSIENLGRLDDDLSRIAHANGQEDRTFEQGCNLQWCFVENRSRIHLRIFERGEGVTLASGSSASAACIAARTRGLLDASATVVMPGGELEASLVEKEGTIVAVELVAAVGLVGMIAMNDPSTGITLKGLEANAQSAIPVIGEPESTERNVDVPFN